MFWSNSEILKNLRLIEGKTQKTYLFNDFEPLISLILEKISIKKKSVIALICDNSYLSVLSYLAALRSGNAVLLLNYSTDEQLLRELISTYTPELIIQTNTSYQFDNYQLDYNFIDGLSLQKLNFEINSEIYPDTAVLLSTSGTTGSPKLVRLSYKNVQSNAESIAEYLKIEESETAITSLPMSYSYGLSVINSHILKGASIVLTNETIAQKSFWDLFKELSCTSYAGVPYNYFMLERLRFERMNLPSLKYMTQAGGKLAPEKIKHFYEISKAKNFKFFVMYGQTEATARISYVPYEKLGEKIGSAGIPIPGGRISIMDEDSILPAGENGEVVYSGPNVMLGYAEKREDLAKGDELKGVLRTGDIGYLDNDGFLFITGRLKRFIKVLGQRVNLDEVEKFLEAHLSLQVALPVSDDEIHILIESKNKKDEELVTKIVSETYGFHHSLIVTKCIEQIPVNSSGKKDYPSITKIFANERN
ncbi:MAG: AMP-binding protein [Candidatus Kapabacteria bacterium]|nr:AMP-binding protein [Candidatus Kapabacteria bacterium]